MAKAKMKGCYRCVTSFDFGRCTQNLAPISMEDVKEMLNTAVGKVCYMYVYNATGEELGRMSEHKVTINV